MPTVLKPKNLQMDQILDEHTIAVSLPNKLGYERIAMECSASYARMVGFLPERIEDLKTAVSEACVNAMEHGNKKHPDSRVIININYRDHVFTVSVMDQGKGIQKLSKDIEHPDIEKKINCLQAPRGLGIFLIKQLVDQVEFNQMTQEGHMVRMILRLTG